MIETGSNIPGATPIDDVSGLRIKSLTTRQQLYEAEFRNTVKVINKYLARKPTRRMAPFTVAWIVKLHKEMFGDVWRWAGKIRQTEKNIGIKPYQIKPALENLLQDLVAWQDSGMDLVEQATTLHHRAVQIHPFDNGNGRWARLLANIWLKQNGRPLTHWPDKDMSEGTSSIRGDYLKAIKSADKGSYKDLIELHKRYTPES